MNYNCPLTTTHHNPFKFSTQILRCSRPENKVIVYRAFTKGEAKKLQLATLVLKSGNYVSEVSKDYQKNIVSITTIFQKLLRYPNIDPSGYCVEWQYK